MSGRPRLRVLIVEDSEFDARVLVNSLRQGGYDVAFTRVDTAAAMQEALQREPWDAVLADYNLPDFNAPAALATLQASGVDIPFLIVSGGIGEDVAVAAMKSGAHDYLMKGSLARLVPAVEREIKDAGVRRARRAAEENLRASERRYRTLWETSPDAVVFCTADGAMLQGNPAMHAVFGLTPAALAGRPVGDLEPPHTHGALADALRELAIRADALRLPRETPALTAGGREGLIEFTAAVMEVDGRPGAVLFIRDITEKRRAEAELLHNQEQLHIARDIQQQLYPRAAPRLDGFDLAGASYPTEATGGDYYDFLPMADGSLGLVMADVSGHGLGPALLMAQTRAYLRILTRNRHDPGEILTRANRVLVDDLSDDRYVTLLLARLNAATRELVYASGGHPPALLFDAHGRVRQILRRNGPVLGLEADTAFRSAPPHTLAPRETLVLLTDGVLDATGPDGAAFGPEGVARVVAEHPAADAAGLVHALYQAVEAHNRGGPERDDVTLVVVRAK